MGATVFNAARVSTRMTATGQVAYLWVENTHCIKDGPKKASWCAMAFGTKEDIVRRIYLLAASVPGGMLKVGGRSVTAFVDAMLKLLEEPQNLVDEVVHLENHTKGFYTAIHDFNRGAIRRYLIDSGRADLAEKIKDPGLKPTEVAFSLDTDFVVLRHIMNDLEYEGQDINDRPSRQKGMPKWHVFPHCYANASGSRGPTEVSKPVGQKPAVDVKVFRTDINLAYGGADSPSKAYLATLNGELFYVGSMDYGAYAVESSAVAAAGRMHIASGHNVLRQILKDLSKASKDPQAVPGDSIFTFTDTGEPWVSRNFEAVRAKLGKAECGAFSVTADELTLASQQPSNQLRYLFDAGLHNKVLSVHGLENRLA